ncbi:MAG: hypothetical protein KC417_16705, partial [Myxococcales bacterium]|nr:hypothetical protein [Myxococcales bacterium]
RYLRSARLRLAAILSGLVVLGVVTVFHLAAPKAPAAAWETSQDLAIGTLVVFLVPFMFGPALVSEEVSSRTLPFLLVRSVGRIRLGLGKLVAASAATVSIVFVASLLLFVGCLAPHGESFGTALPAALRSAAAMGLLAAYYTAVGFFWSAAIPSSANVATAIHFAILEFGVSHAPGFVRLGAMRHMASVLSHNGLGADAGGSIPDVPTWAAAAILALALSGATVAGLLAFQGREYRIGVTS